MKEIMSLITFGIWALFLVVFFAALKPDVVIAVTGRASPASPTLACGSLIFAAALRPDVGQR